MGAHDAGQTPTHRAAAFAAWVAVGVGAGMTVAGAALVMTPDLEAPGAGLLAAGVCALIIAVQTL